MVPSDMRVRVMVTRRRIATPDIAQRGFPLWWFKTIF